MRQFLRKKIPLLLCLLLIVTLIAGCNAPEGPSYEVGRIRNIVLIIGDGMGPSHVQMGEMALGEEFVFRNWHHTSCNTNSLSVLNQPTVTTDSAASATAMATGVLTKNNKVGLNADGESLKTILDYASQDYGKRTGVVTTDLLSGATPASFTAHSVSRTAAGIILDSQSRSGVHLLCSDITEGTKELAEAEGYAFCDDYSKIGDTMSAGKTYWQFAMSGATPKQSLATVSVDALNYLSQGEYGFVLMIEQAHVDKFSHSNDAEGALACVLSLNETVKAVLNWVGDRNDTLILVTADHETGGLQISRDPIYDQSLTSGQGNTVYYQFTDTDHTSTMVDLYVYGIQPDFAALSYDNDPAYIKNTAIFEIMMDALKNPNQP